MRSLGIALLLSAVFVPALACEVRTSYRDPAYAGQVQVQTPPTAQVDVQAGDPNAQAQVDPNAQAVDPNAAQGDPNDQDPSAINDFRDALAPYGQWMDDPNYGTIWMPNPGVVGGDFTPYQTAGHWVYDTDYTWVSDYDWGWAPFHYGRWFAYPGRGWAWVPGKEYAGAWVTWRNADDPSVGAVGWAPTPPAFYWRNQQPVVITQPWYTPQYTYVVSTDLFAPTIRERIIRDPVRIRGYEARTRVYEPRGGYVAANGGVRMRVRGPEPTRIGLNASVLPRPPANNPQLVRAQQFSRTTRPVNVQQNGGRTVTPTHPPIDMRNQQGRVNEHPTQVNAQQQQQQMHPVNEHPTPINAHEQQQQGQRPNVQQTTPPHVEQQHQVAPPPPTASQRRSPAPPPVQHRGR